MHFRLSFAATGWLLTIVGWLWLSSVLNSSRNHSNCNLFNDFDTDSIDSYGLANSNDNEIGEWDSGCTAISSSCLLICFSFSVQLLFDHIRDVYYVLLVGQQFPLLQRFFDGEWLVVGFGLLSKAFIFRARTLEGSWKSAELSSLAWLDPQLCIMYFMLRIYVIVARTSSQLLCLNLHCSLRFCCRQFLFVVSFCEILW